MRGQLERNSTENGPSQHGSRILLDEDRWQVFLGLECDKAVSAGDREVEGLYGACRGGG